MNSCLSVNQQAEPLTIRELLIPDERRVSIEDHAAWLEGLKAEPEGEEL